MNDLIVWRDKLQELYAMKSIYIDKAVQFVLALVTFLMINQNIGLMKAVATDGHMISHISILLLYSKNFIRRMWRQDL